MGQVWSLWVEFLNSNAFTGAATLCTAGVAYLIYKDGRREAKRDIAKLLVQEIRRCEDLIRSYQQMKTLSFTKQLVPVNSWKSGISFFVDDLNVDEIDAISTAYSTGEYLDGLIKNIADKKFHILAGHVSPAKTKKGRRKVVQTYIWDPQWNALIDDVVAKHEFIFRSDILRKLKKIAGVK